MNEEALKKLAEEHGHAVGEKCSACPPESPPYRAHGGALTFAEMQDYKEAMRSDMAYSIAANDFNILSSNILSDPELDAGERADALVALAEEYKTVVGDIEEYYPEAFKELVDGTKPYSAGDTSGLPPNVRKLSGKRRRQWVDVFNSVLDETGDESRAFASANSVAGKKELDEGNKAGRRMSASKRGVLASIVENAQKLMGWADYDEEDEDEKETAVDLKEFLDTDEVSGFKVYYTPEGPRWLAFSSNSFVDKEDEIFTQQTLENAVAYGDKTGDRGPLRVFHVKGADIGDCDFQTTIGRFLVESGTFRDDELGTKGLSFLQQASSEGERFQVSIGYKYKRGDELDGVYDWIRIEERSITPYGAAANPYTAFALDEAGGEKVDKTHEDMLNRMFGTKTTAGLKAKAEERTKELEGIGVRFKEMPELATRLKSIAESLPADSAQRAELMTMVNPPVPEPEPSPEPTPEPEPAPPAPEVAGAKDLATALTVADVVPMANTIIEMGTLLAEVRNGLKELTEKVSAGQTPAPRIDRPTQSEGNVIDLNEKAKEMLGMKEMPPQQSGNPVAPYISQVFGPGAVANG